MFIFIICILSLPVSAVEDFELHQYSPGRIADVNAWDYAMSSEQINSSCSDSGNVVNMNSLSMAGAVNHFEFMERTCYINIGNALYFLLLTVYSRDNI